MAWFAIAICRSGKTVVEAVLGGYRAWAVTSIRCSVSMARTKSALLRLPRPPQQEAYEAIRSELVRGLFSARPNGLPYFRSSTPQSALLNTWFSEQVLYDLDPIASTIQRLHGPGDSRDFMMLALSNVIAVRLVAERG